MRKNPDSINAKNINGDTPLIKASGHIMAATENDCVKALIDGGADINAANFHGHTPLFAAFLKKRTEAINELVAAGADAKTVTAITNENILHLFANDSSTQGFFRYMQLERIMSLGVSLDENDFFFRTPSITATYSDNYTFGMAILKVQSKEPPNKQIGYYLLKNIIKRKSLKFLLAVVVVPLESPPMVSDLLMLDIPFLEEEMAALAEPLIQLALLKRKEVDDSFGLNSNEKHYLQTHHWPH